jgi:hypothetical protein
MQEYEHGYWDMPSYIRVSEWVNVVERQLGKRLVGSESE